MISARKTDDDASVVDEKVDTERPRRVWIYNDLPVGVVAGASLMASRWESGLGAFGLSTRLFSPSGTLRAERGRDRVAFRTLRHVGYAGDWHARFSMFAELRRATDELPDAILVSTPLRIGLLGLTTAARFGVPLIVVHSTDTSTMSQYHGSFRALASTGSKLIALEVVSSTVRRAFWGATRLAAAVRERREAGIIAVHGMKAIYSHADAIVVLGEKMRREVSNWDVDVPVHAVPIGVDRLPMTEADSPVRWPEGRLRLLYVGRFSREKNVLLPIHALRVALDHGVDAHLVFCGEGHMRGQMDRLVQELGLDDHVEMVGPLEHDDLRPVYESADVFVFPSRSDAQAMALNEAAHEALPIIGIDPLVNSVLVDGHSGLIVEDDAVAFAGAIAAMTDSDVRAAMGAQAREFACATTEKTQLAKLADLIHDAVDADRRAKTPSSIATVDR